MTQQSVLTRRAVCIAALSAPCTGMAAPLFDLTSGGGLFSKSSTFSSHSSGSLDLFGNPSSTNRNSLTSQAEFIASRPLQIAFENPNTNESLAISLRTNAGLGTDQTGQIHRFLRDWRRNEIKIFDSNILKTFLEICNHFGRGGNPVKVRITSGYRSKATNDQLRRTSQNVARNSLHVQARAIDFSLQDVPMSVLTRTARRICPGGVGRYPNFVHIDSGPLRRWSA